MFEVWLESANGILSPYHTVTNGNVTCESSLDQEVLCTRSD
jgi:hypothetical protein